MEAVREYILSVTAVAVICAIVQRLLSGKGMPAAMAKLLCGLLLTFAVIKPLTSFSIGDFSDWTADYETDASKAVAAGENSTRTALAQSIKSQAEAYILDKAASLNVSVTVQVTVSDDDIPVPIKVTISGEASPYAKGRLQSIIEDDLGIAKEEQQWI